MYVCCCFSQNLSFNTDSSILGYGAVRLASSCECCMDLQVCSNIRRVSCSIKMGLSCK